jgi:hypothetical protein
MATGSFFAPSVSLSFLRVPTGTLDVTGGGAASFTWTTGRIDGCAVAWPPGRARLLGCARVEAGLLEAAGSGVGSAKSRGTFWFAAGPLVRAEWEILPPLFVAADGALMVRATADRFYFTQDSTVYTVPYVGAEAAVGVGVSFL